MIMDPNHKKPKQTADDMLEPWIIEEIRRREEEERRDDRPVLEIPREIPMDEGNPEPDETPEPGTERGVVKIQFK